jgi:hypothetical protein
MLEFQFFELLDATALGEDAFRTFQDSFVEKDSQRRELFAMHTDEWEFIFCVRVT